MGQIIIEKNKRKVETFKLKGNLNFHEIIFIIYFREMIPTLISHDNPTPS